MRKGCLVVLILLAGLVVIADRVGARVAQNEIGKQVAAQYDLSQQPTVTIHGFPFLTQAIGGEYEKIDADVGDITRQGTTVDDVRVELSGVEAPLPEVISGNTENVVARTAMVSGTIPYTVVDEHAPQGVTVSPAGSDLRLRGNLAVAGITGRVMAIVSVKATSRGITVTPRSVRSGSGPQIPLALAQRRFTFMIPVPELPMRARITRVDVTRTGLRVAATANDVKLSAA